MNKAGRTFGLAATYIGTVIGAGFASGQEIWTFFGRYGPAGAAGLAVAGFLIAWAGYRALEMGADRGSGMTYYQCLQTMFHRAAPFFDLILLFFLVVLGGVMLAGAGAVSTSLGWPAWLGVTGTAALGLAVIAADLPGLVRVNKIVVPCLIAALAAVAAGNLSCRPLPPMPCSGKGWLPASLLYASYNTVLSFPVLVALGSAEPDRQIRGWGSFWAAAGLSLMGGAILWTLLRRPLTAMMAEVPMASVAADMGGAAGFLYSLALWGEMFTTLVADLYGAAARLGQVCGGSRTLWAALAMSTGLVLSKLGFARLIRTAYPAFGLICLVILARLAWPAGSAKYKAQSR